MNFGYEIIKYFASRNMGSEILQTVQVIWDRLDEIEKQMVASLQRSKFFSGMIINSNVYQSQEELQEAINNTPFVTI